MTSRRRLAVGARPRVRLGETERRGREGFTLLVVVVFIIVYGLVLLAGIGFIAEAQLDAAAAEGPALLNLRVALETLENDLPKLEVHPAGGETTLVYADNDGIAFFYQDPRQDTAMTPDAGDAELVTLWFEPDPATARPDDFRLRRHVDGGEPIVVARRLFRDGSAPFFEYVVSAEPGGPSQSPTAVVPVDVLPIGAMAFEEDGPRGRVAAQSARPARRPSRAEGAAEDPVGATRNGLTLRGIRVTIRGGDETEDGGDDGVTVRRLIAVATRPAGADRS